MLIVSGTSREENRKDLARQLCQLRVPVRLVIGRSRLTLESVLWREYWEPAREFFEVDLCLRQRLNRLKKAWRNLLQDPTDRLGQMIYCWRYFGLLHHSLRIAREEPSRPNPLIAIRRIIGFETFRMEALGERGIAACAVTSRNPVFLLGQLAVDPAVSTPRHVPLMLPLDSEDAFYCYRQLQISGMPAQRLLVSPAIDLPHRAASFIPIDRLSRLVSDKADPYRALADDDQWLSKYGPFDWVFACRILDNASNFMIEPADENEMPQNWPDSLPHRCLAPHAQPEGIRRLQVSTTRRRARGGSMHPQFSLHDYFDGLLSIQTNSLHRGQEDHCYLPVRRFNPAALLTPSGRSLISQLLKVSRAIIIEDIDVEPEHLMQHRDQFGLPGTAAVFCTHDGFNTEARHYVITSPEWAQYIAGDRLW